jgi:hypothetical protein
MNARAFTRRAFVARLTLAGSALGALSGFGWVREHAPALSTADAPTGAPSAQCRATPVVSFHLDQPCLDWSGEGLPYVPPAGARAGDALACLSEAELFCCMHRY